MHAHFCASADVDVFGFVEAGVVAVLLADFDEAVHVFVAHGDVSRCAFPAVDDELQTVVFFLFEIDDFAI